MQPHPDGRHAEGGEHVCQHREVLRPQAHGDEECQRFGGLGQAAEKIERLVGISRAGQAALGAKDREGQRYGGIEDKDQVDVEEVAAIGRRRLASDGTVQAVEEP